MWHYVFESFVNSERCKTMWNAWQCTSGLRALLIQKDVKQCRQVLRFKIPFESFVNSERCKTNE